MIVDSLTVLERYLTAHSGKPLFLKPFMRETTHIDVASLELDEESCLPTGTEDCVVPVEPVDEHKTIEEDRETRLVWANLEQ